MQAGIERFSRRGLYLVLSLLMWIIALVGFWPGYVGPMSTGTLDKTDSVHAHVAVYIGWLILYTVQSTLPMARKGRLHRKLGRFGIAYGVLVWIMGLSVTFSRFEDRVRLGELDEARFQALPPLTDMLIFPVLFGLAIHYRTRPEIHKRFMVLTGTLMMIAAVSRMATNGIIPMHLLPILAVWLSPIVIAMLHDAWFERRLHPVYGFGIVALAVLPLRMALIETAGWRSITTWAAETFIS